MNRILLVTVMSIYPWLSFADDGGPHKVEVFTNDHFQIANISAGSEPSVNAVQATVYNLDDSKRYLRELNEVLGLPRPAKNDVERQAIVDQVKSRQDDTRIRDLTSKITHSEVGVAAAGFNYQLTKIPAFVFDDGVAVVYGVTDLKIAIDQYNQWRRRQSP